MTAGATMRQEVVWAIRDARGLDSAEKMFLTVVESRGQMFSKWHVAAADMGMTKSTYYRTRERVLAAGLVRHERRHDSTTAYVVDAEKLADHLPERVCG